MEHYEHNGETREYLLPGGFSVEVGPIKQVVKEFVTQPNLYYGVTCQGVIFHILRCKTLPTSIAHDSHYFSFMLIKALEGIFILRSHCYNNIPLDWVLEARISPCQEDFYFFEKICDIFEENSRIPENISGEALSFDHPDYSHNRKKFV